MKRKPNFAQFQISLKVVLKNRRSEVLLLRAISTGSMPKCYDLPGGRIMENELSWSIKKVLTRELREELGPKVRYVLHEVPVALGRHSYRIRGDGVRQPVVWILFHATYLGGEIRISHEHPSFIWKRVTQKNLSTLFDRGARDAMKHYLTSKLPSSYVER